MRVIWSSVLYLIILTLCMKCNYSSSPSGSPADQYFDKIYFYNLKFTDENNLSLAEYIKYARPFGILDCRPMNLELLEVRGEKQPVSIFPNFAYGGVAHKLEFPAEIAQGIVKVFNNASLTQMMSNIRKYNIRSSDFESLKNMVQESDFRVIYCDSLVKRIDDCYFYKNQYMKYVIPNDSPFPISDSLVITDCSVTFINYVSFFKLMEELGIISIYKTSTFIAFIIEGMLDNSRGYIYSFSNEPIRTTPLFNFVELKEINKNVYYYVAF